MGIAYLALDRLHPSGAEGFEHPSRTVTDAQSKKEVVDQARRIVATAGLQKATGGYLLMSCKDRDDPPYQGAVYLDFAVPAEVRVDEFFQNIAAAMGSRGWTVRLPPWSTACPGLIKSTRARTAGPTRRRRTFCASTTCSASFLMPSSST